MFFNLNIVIAARCKSSKCNLEQFDIEKPDDVSLRSAPVWASRRFNNMPKHVEVLVPVGCFCEVVDY